MLYNLQNPSKETRQSLTRLPGPPKMIDLTPEQLVNGPSFGVFCRSKYSLAEGALAGQAAAGALSPV